jgi:hypothetical protein
VKTLLLVLALLSPTGEGSDRAPAVHVRGWYNFDSLAGSTGWRYTEAEYSFVILPRERVRVAWDSYCRIRGVTHTAGTWDTQVCAA